MNYSELLSELKGVSKPSYAAFHSRLLNDPSVRVLGVRVPVLRKIAKAHRNALSDVLSFPNDYYEVVFIKLSMVASLPYEEFLPHLFEMVSLIDNWACCDCFAPKCIAKHKEEFLPVLEEVFSHGGEFFERFALVTLLQNYVSKEYLPLIFSYCNRADPSFYYVHMAVAWLVAEVLVRFPEEGETFLREETLAVKTHNKAIQKARESYRLTGARKCMLKSLKR